MTPEMMKVLGKSLDNEGYVEFGEVTTEDDTATIIGELAINDNTIGAAEFYMVATVSDGSGYDGVNVVVKYSKVGGTLTMLTPHEAVPFSNNLNDGLYSIIDNSGNIAIEATGNPTIPIVWNSKGKIQLEVNHPGT